MPNTARTALTGASGGGGQWRGARAERTSTRRIGELAARGDPPTPRSRSLPSPPTPPRPPPLAPRPTPHPPSRPAAPPARVRLGGEDRRQDAFGRGGAAAAAHRRYSVPHLLQRDWRRRQAPGGEPLRHAVPLLGWGFWDVGLYLRGKKTGGKTMGGKNSSGETMRAGKCRP